ncbi:MAG: hypothetical protein ACK5PZ_14030 [Pirellula sp.]
MAKVQVAAFKPRGIHARIIRVTLRVDTQTTGSNPASGVPENDKPTAPSFAR